MAAAIYYLMPLIIKPEEYPALEAEEPSFIFNGASNVEAQGIPVPLVYGLVKTGSITVSSGFIAEEVERSTVTMDQTFNTIRFVDIISEGEIEGLLNSAKSIFLNDVPLQNPDDTFNYDGVVYDVRDGASEQSHIPGFSQSRCSNH